MLSISILTTTIFGVLFCATYYLIVCALKRRWIQLEPKKLLFYVSLFCLYGIGGEIVVNSLWVYSFGEPLWEYRLFPAQNAHISYFFPLIWGSLGFYKYINDTVWHKFESNQVILPGLIMGAEAIFLEILYNGLFLLLFDEYIFYYLPASLGPFSHLSCLEVLPFYFMVGLVITILVKQQNKIGYSRSIVFTISFYWMIIAALLLL
ncbi:MAG: hypothetical protein ACI9SY_000067 [Candidatus Paceibacteria bacterium]|jgi:hypothetical protein